MKKINKREIIILAIAALAVLYGAYEFLIAQPAARKARIEAKPIEVGSLVTKINTDLAKDKISELDVSIATKADKEWSKSPFWDRSSYLELAGNEESMAAGLKVIYSGYVDAGRKAMAIINGSEYEAGESLEIEGYMLQSVTPSRIIIVNRSTGSELYVPIQE